MYIDNNQLIVLNQYILLFNLGMSDYFSKIFSGNFSILVAHLLSY